MWKLLEPRSTAARTSGRTEAAGRTLTKDSSGGEGRAAAAGSRGVWVADHELSPVQALAIIDLRAHEVLHAHGVDQELHPEVLDAGVAVLGLLVELEAVLQSRAAAALHEDAQHEVWIALAADQIADLA